MDWCLSGTYSIFSFYAPPTIVAGYIVFRSVRSSVVRPSHFVNFDFLGNYKSHCHEILYTDSLYQGQYIAAKNGLFGQCLSIWETQVYLFVDLFRPSHFVNFDFLGNYKSHCHEILYTDSLYQGQYIAAKNGLFGQCLSVWETQVYLFDHVPGGVSMSSQTYACLFSASIGNTVREGYEARLLTSMEKSDFHKFVLQWYRMY